jgi:cytochrome c2
MYKAVIIIVLAVFLTACSNQNDEQVNTTEPKQKSTAGHKMGKPRADSALQDPKVPFKYAIGKKKFQTMCADCHGMWGGGSDQGPPLMHLFYVSSHHSDVAFYNAALKGVQQHHWKFGDMPAVKGATERDVKKIIAFVRWLQKENGIL